LFIRSDDKFFLKGIVSSSLFDHDKRCDVNNFAVYTDVSKYQNWIMSPHVKITEASTSKPKYPQNNNLQTTTTARYYQQPQNSQAVIQPSTINPYYNPEVKLPKPEEYDTYKVEQSSFKVSANKRVENTNPEMIFFPGNIKEKKLELTEYSNTKVTVKASISTTTKKSIGQSRGEQYQSQQPYKNPQNPI
jgi:hypothetical protein